MRSIAEISKQNTLVEISKQQFLARALNNPKKQDKPWLAKVLRDAKKSYAERPAWAKECVA